MARRRHLGLGLLAAMAASALLAFASTASAHQTVTIEEGGGMFGDRGTRLIIHGDTRPDLVTVTYDPYKEEFVVGHDIEDPIPNGCYRDAEEPFHILHCPASLFSGPARVYIYTGEGSDKVVTTMRLGDVVVAALGTGNDSFEGGDEDDEANGEEGSDQASTGEGKDTVNAGPGSDKANLGGGDDSADLGLGADTAYGGPGGDSFYGRRGIDHLYGGPGGDWLFGGAGGDFLYGGAGSDHCAGGPGKESVFSCEIGYRY